jgi:hypothetical protein
VRSQDHLERVRAVGPMQVLRAVAIAQDETRQALDAEDCSLRG